MLRLLFALLALMLAAAAVTQTAVVVSRRSAWRSLRGSILGDLDAGSLQRLQRARAVGIRLVVADAGDADAHAALSFVSAILARDYGLATDRESATAAVRAASAASLPASHAALLGAARALLALGRGDLGGASEIALRAAAASREHVYPLLALALVRERAGDPIAASRTLEAAMVKAPGFRPAATAWAQVRIDLGDPAAAAAALRSGLARAPDHTRALLLLAEADRALGLVSHARRPPGAVPSPWAAGCRRDRAAAPVLAAACELAAAADAVSAGDRREALVRAEAAMAVAPADPRVLALAAQALAQLGRIDAAAELVERAARHARDGMPALAWARLAVTLGRGGVGTVEPGLRPGSPETRRLAARAALAAGGAGALAAVLAEREPAADLDPDLRLLRLVAETHPSASAEAPGRARLAAREGPVGAYVAGLLARLAGDQAAAEGWLADALDGHGDACRAAGEYLAAQRALKLPPPPDARLAPLRAHNAECVNVPPAWGPLIERGPSKKGKRKPRALRGHPKP